MEDTNTAKDQLLSKLAKGDVKVGIIGLGYIGLPLCVATVRAGLSTVGFDTDTEKCVAVSEGKSLFNHVGSASITEAVKAGRLEATADFARLAEPDILVICVPTPLSQGREPDLSHLIETAEKIAGRLRRGQLIVLESTAYPGTTAEVLRPILERPGLVVDRDFFLAFSPERLDLGNDTFDTHNTPKVIGADGDASRAVAEAFYALFVETVVPVSDTRTAETIKLAENAFRSVNIALANELKTICEPLGVDIWEVIDAAKTKPFGFMPFYPGPGIGGHCIPIDPVFLSWKARQVDVPSRLIDMAGQINASMPMQVLERLASLLQTRANKTLEGARILIAGIAYKKNVDDLRESPALDLMERLLARGAHIDFVDPLVQKIPVTHQDPTLAGRESVAWRADLSKGYDAVLIVTDHDLLDYRALVDHAALVVDTRDACRKHGITSDKIALV